MDPKEAARRILERYQHDPVAFIEVVLGASLWSRQVEIAEAVDRHPRVAVKSGQKTGKTTIAAGLSIWWSLTRWRGQVRVTAPAKELIKDAFWTEFHQLYRSARIPLGPEPNTDPATGWRLPGDRGVHSITTNKPERAAGRSGANQLYIIDEASGLDEEAWEPIIGNLAGGGHALAISNPTNSSGTFHAAFHQARDVWYGITVDARENPNFHGGHIPGLATPDAVKLIVAQYGADSPFFDVRVAGRFPRQGSNAVIPLQWVEDARERHCSVAAVGRLSFGVDVARFGEDNTSVTARRGMKVIARREVHGFDGVQVFGLVLEMVRDLREPADTGPNCPRVKIDCGGNGAGPTDMLIYAQEEHDIEVCPVEFGGAAIDPNFARARDELWFAGRSWLADGGAIPEDPRLAAELVTPTYRFDARGRHVVESKDEMRKRLRRSPDAADSFCLAVYEPPARDFTGAVALPVRTGFRDVGDGGFREIG